MRWRTWTTPRSSRLALALMALGAALWGVCGCTQRPKGTRVVLITLDTLRFDDFMGDGSAPSNMPRTRAFVERGALFEHSFAASSTTQPSHASLLTGLHPWEHGLTRNGEVLEERFETAAELLCAAGFSTRAVVSSFPLERRFGFDQGFASFEDRFEASIGHEQWMGQSLRDQAFYSYASRTTERALALLDSDPAERQFLWLHYFDPHDPYGDCHVPLGEPAPPNELQNVLALREAAAQRDPGLARKLEQAREGYARDLAFLDAALAPLFERLAADERRFTTHVVITADHGESFGEDGSIGHGRRLTWPQLHVPLSIVSPRVPSGPRQDAAGSVDVFATLLDLAGIPPPPGHGRSLVKSSGVGSACGMRQTFAAPAYDQRIDGTRREISSPAYFTFHGGRLVTGTPDGTLFASPGGPIEDRALAAQLQGLFAGFEARRTEHSTPRALQDEETANALRALGYTR